MDRTEILEVLRATAADVLAAPDLQESDALAQRAHDSLALVEWVMDLEDAFGIELTEAEVVAAPTVGELADLVLDKAPRRPS